MNPKRESGHLSAQIQIASRFFALAKKVYLVHQFLLKCHLKLIALD